MSTTTSISEPVELFDRNRLLVDLDEATDPASPDSVLVVVALRGLGETFAELGADPVVSQLRDRFAAVVGSAGAVYRTRSTELCAILDGDVGELEGALDAVREVFVAEASRLGVGVAVGVVELPGEAEGAPEALMLADRRLSA